MITKKTRKTRRVGSHSQGAAPWTSKKRSKEARRTYPENWKEITAFIKKRDNYTCTKCGCTRLQAQERGINLIVDHIIRLADGGSNAFSNLRTLCDTCHANRLNHRHLRIR